jgi:hypothetical protein
LTEPKPKRVRRAKEQPIKVVRDGSFHRLAAENGFVFPVANETELSFMQGGPLIESVMYDSKTGIGFQSEDVLTEVARVRMPWPGAYGLAMNVLGIGMASGRFDREQTLKLISEMEFGGSMNDDSQ